MNCLRCAVKSHSYLHTHRLKYPTSPLLLPHQCLQILLFFLSFSVNFYHTPSLDSSLIHPSFLHNLNLFAFLPNQQYKQHTYLKFPGLHHLISLLHLILQLVLTYAVSYLHVQATKQLDLKATRYPDFNLPELHLSALQRTHLWHAIMCPHLDLHLSQLVQISRSLSCHTVFLMGLDLFLAMYSQPTLKS